MENKVSMWKQINYWKVYTQTISKQCPAMINFTLRNSTKTYCPFKISSPAEILGCCQWLNCYSQTLATWVWNSIVLDYQKTLPGYHFSSLYSHSASFGETETKDLIHQSYWKGSRTQCQGVIYTEAKIVDFVVKFKSCFHFFYVLILGKWLTPFFWD